MSTPRVEKKQWKMTYKLMSWPHLDKKRPYSKPSRSSSRLARKSLDNCKKPQDPRLSFDGSPKLKYYINAKSKEEIIHSTSPPPSSPLELLECKKRLDFDSPNKQEAFEEMDMESLQEMLRDAVIKSDSESK